MRRSIPLLLLALCLSVVGFVWTTPALAASSGVHAVQGRSRKKAHRGGKSQRKSTPKAAPKSAKKNDRGFEL